MARNSVPQPFTVLPDALYTTTEAARFLRLRPNTLENWRMKGKRHRLRFRRIGGCVRYAGQDLLDFINGKVRR